ncbi:hypothetical protein [Arvimicrobium flavum]|nr:hypothetical protein [Mesorhizobium shangrilense]
MLTKRPSAHIDVNNAGHDGDPNETAVFLVLLLVAFPQLTATFR